MFFSPNDKDQASDDKSMFFFTEMKSEFQPLLYQQVEEPKGVRCISGVTSYLRDAERDRPRKRRQPRPCHIGFMAKPQVESRGLASLTSSVNCKRSLGRPSYYT